MKQSNITNPPQSITSQENILDLIEINPPIDCFLNHHYKYIHPQVFDCYSSTFLIVVNYHELRMGKIKTDDTQSQTQYDSIKHYSKQGKLLSQYQATKSIIVKVTMLNNYEVVFLVKEQQQQKHYFKLIQWNLKDNSKVEVKQQLQDSYVGMLYAFKNSSLLCVMCKKSLYGKGAQLFYYKYPLTVNMRFFHYTCIQHQLNSFKFAKLNEDSKVGEIKQKKSIYCSNNETICNFQIKAHSLEKGLEIHQIQIKMNHLYQRLFIGLTDIWEVQPNVYYFSMMKNSRRWSQIVLPQQSFLHYYYDANTKQLSIPKFVDKIKQNPNEIYFVQFIDCFRSKLCYENFSMYPYLHYYVDRISNEIVGKKNLLKENQKGWYFLTVPTYDNIQILYINNVQQGKQKNRKNIIEIRKINPPLITTFLLQDLIQI